MAHKKEPPKPIFQLKHDFYVSLDHLLHEIIMFVQATEQAIKLGAVKDGPAKEILQERLDAVRQAMSEGG